MPENSEKTLGLTQIPPETFEHDLRVNEKYQSFSREMLRLSIAGIGTIGLVVFSKADSSFLKVSRYQVITFFGLLLFLSAISFLLSMAFSLVHLYVSADAEAFHLRFLRMQITIPKVAQPDNIRGISGFSDYWLNDETYSKLTSLNDKAWKEREVRNYLMKLAGRVLFWAAFSLGAGGLFFVLSMIVLILN
ncbi:MAG TPA: hypothetical protein PKA82_03175 [Pyrinomonadaceae bacterium]|nr:hypothetical protein [Pyrinomonadaceae bacterium]